MPRTKQTDKLAALLEERRQLDNQIANAQAKAREQARKDDTHRKVIAGALSLEHMAKNPQSEFAKILGRLLDEYVKRPAERALFPSLPASSPEETGTLDRYLENRPVLADTDLQQAE